MGKDSAEHVADAGGDGNAALGDEQVNQQRSACIQKADGCLLYTSQPVVSLKMRVDALHPIPQHVTTGNIKTRLMEQVLSLIHIFNITVDSKIIC